MLVAALFVASQLRVVAVSGDVVDGNTVIPNGTVSVGGNGHVCFSEADPPFAFCDRGNGLHAVLDADRRIPGLDFNWTVSRIGDGSLWSDAVAIDALGNIAYLADATLLVVERGGGVGVLARVGDLAPEGRVFGALLLAPRIVDGRVSFVGLRSTGSEAHLYGETSGAFALEASTDDEDSPLDLDASFGDAYVMTVGIDANRNEVLVENGRVVAAYGERAGETGGTFERFIATAVDDNGDVAFTAQINGGPSSGEIALFAKSARGVEALAVPGDDVALHDGDVGRIDQVVLVPEGGQRGPETFTHGQLGYAAELTDGRVAVFLRTQPF